MFVFKVTAAIRTTLCFLITAIALFTTSCRQTHSDAYYDNILNKALSMHNAGHRKAAGLYLDSVRRVTHSSPHFLVVMYKHKAHWAYLDNKYEINKQMLDSELAVISRHKLEESHRTEYVDALNERGYVYLHENELDKAFEYFSRGRTMAYGSGDTCANVHRAYALGMVTYRQKKYRDAIKFFHESLDQIQKCPWDIYAFFKKEELLLNIGLAYSELSSYDSASTYYTLALTITDSAAILFPNDTNAANFRDVALGVIKASLAEVFIAQQRPDTAIVLLKDNVAANNKQYRDVHHAMSSRMQLAELYHKQGRSPETLIELTQLQRTLDSLPNTPVRARMLHLYYLYYRAQKSPLAGEYFDRYQALKDSMDLAANEVNKTDYAVQLRDKDNEHHIAMLTKDNEVGRLYLGIALLSSVLAGAIILLIYRNYNRSRKNVRALTSLNQRMSEQKQALENAMDQLRETSSAKDKILQIVAHDLRNPISGILTLAPMVASDPLSDLQAEMITLIGNASHSAMALIDEILEYSATTQDLITEKTDINTLISQATALLQLKADSKHQEIILAIPTHPIFVMAHKEKLGRVLNNLLANAIKFSGHSTIIQVLVTESDDQVTVEVRDHGIGIPAASLPNVFELFTTAKRRGTDGEPSFGLGLSICRQIMHAHKGTIWVESTEGQGSSFYFSLPKLS